MPAPLLEGVRVVEFSQLIAAPFCGLTLADLGAEVVKVESPAGDSAREFPPYLGADGPSGSPPENSAFFHALNRGKRGVAVSLDDPLVEGLVERADVVVENLGDAGSALPRSAEEFVAARPSLVWCSITGWGRGGGGRALDPSLQAAFGLMSITGERGGAPLRVPVPLVDFMTGQYAVASVLAALWRVARDGAGGVLDCAMADSTAALTGTAAMLAFGGQLEPRRVGAESHLRVPSGIWAAADGEFVMIVCVTDRHWQAVCRALGHPEWADDERAVSVGARLAHRDLVHGWVASAVAGEAAAHWIDVVNREGALCELVRDIGDGWADPRLSSRGLGGRMADESLSGLPVPTFSLAFTGDAAALERGPFLGEHNAEVAQELLG